MQGARFLAAVAALSSLTGCVIQVPAEQPAPVAQQPQQSEWIQVSIAPDGSSSWEAQRDSFSFAENNSGELVALVNGRVVSYADNKIELFRWHVTLNDCSRKMGQMVYSDTTDAYLGSVEFAFGAGTHASRLAQAICEAAELKAESLNRQQHKQAIAPGGQEI
jgi:hypothetical protein